MSAIEAHAVSIYNRNAKPGAVRADCSMYCTFAHPLHSFVHNFTRCVDFFTTRKEHEYVAWRKKNSAAVGTKHISSLQHEEDNDQVLEIQNELATARVPPRATRTWIRKYNQTTCAPTCWLRDVDLHGCGQCGLHIIQLRLCTPMARTP